MKYRAPRTAIGTKNGRFAYYVSKDRRTPEQLRDLLAASGWDNAIMMDGGGGGLRKRTHARLGRRGRVRWTGLHPC